MRRIYFLLPVLIFISVSLFSQNFSRPGDWKKLRKEVFITMGGANFLGDLGGRDKAGTDYSPADLEFALTKSAFGVGYRYKIQKFLNVTSKFNYLLVRGDDKKTQDIYRNNRNLNFKSNIFELSGRLELGYESGKSGNRYGIKKTFGRRMKSNSYSLFAFTGIGVFYYNPKSIGGIPLRKLHTEGQGLPGGPKQYINYSIAIPFGVLYKYIINKRWSIGVEFAWRKTFTDYIDDVGTKYYDSQALTDAYGTLSAQMADPSLGLIYGASLPDASGNPAQRGDIQKDSYMSIEATVGYIFKPKRKRARLRSKF
ncbi:MAG: DUF6089 family protein [Bacteroidota bacterium]|nr:DUF6089 family protein [Bacteroidota bacterium]